MSDRRPFDGGPLADPEERQVLFATLDSFRQYRRSLHHNVTHRRRQNLYALPSRHRNLLFAPPFNLLDTLNAIDDALDCNSDIADAILESGLRTFGLPAEPEADSQEFWHGCAKPGDVMKAHSTIRQLYRDWSEEGFRAEVEPLLAIVRDDLKHLPLCPCEGAALPSLLLPGAGLARLVFSLHLQGYHVEGNEISYHQLLASNFILNTTHRAQQYTLYPFASTFTNHRSRGNQLKSVCIPDVHPATATATCRREAQAYGPSVGSMNMTAGDFLTSYSDAESRNTFDGVVSVYFIDTAPNLIRYVETIRNCLKDGGVWINIGPLLWHFDDRITDGRSNNDTDIACDAAENEVLRSEAPRRVPDDIGIGEPGAFDLTNEEILLLLQSMGFEILKHDYIPSSHGGYIQDPESMIQNRYECSHWVVRKLS